MNNLILSCSFMSFSVGNAVVVADDDSQPFSITYEVGAGPIGSPIKVAEVYRIFSLRY